MKRRLYQYGCLAAVVAAGVMLIGTVQAQNSATGTPSVSTPRTPDGKPDLSGMWRDLKTAAAQSRFLVGTYKKEENGNSTLRFTSRRCAPTQKGTEGTGCFEETNETADLEFTDRISANRPMYKPEYWDKVQDLDYNTNTKDPVFTCMPMGVPRMGPPAQIIQTAKYVVFFYGGGVPQADQFRIIPIDGRSHDPVRAKDISYFGDAVGRWEGDTLVVEAVGFNDETWLGGGTRGGGGGYFHSYDMKVTERFRREGDIIHYQATVEDPTVLLQPWVMTARELDLNPDPQAYVHEGDQCSQVDPGIVVSRVRH